MTDAFERTAEKMKAHGLSETAIAQFEHLYDVGSTRRTTWIREEDIEPVQDIPNFAQIYENDHQHDKAVDAFAKTAFLKLNGGLGTSMGARLRKIICCRSQAQSQQCASSTSFSDRWKPHVNRLGGGAPPDVHELVPHIGRHHEGAQPMTSGSIRIDIPNGESSSTWSPRSIFRRGSGVSFPSNPDLEWCPPGTRPVIRPSGIGSARHSRKPRIQVPVHLELRQSGGSPYTHSGPALRKHRRSVHDRSVERTEADRKGGHIVRDKVTGRLMLREMTQVAPEDAAKPRTSIKHPYFNTNNIWVRIDSLRENWHRATACSRCLFIRNLQDRRPNGCLHHRGDSARDRDGRCSESVQWGDQRRGGQHCASCR